MLLQTHSRRAFLQRSLALAGGTATLSPVVLGQGNPRDLPASVADTANVIGAYVNIGALYAPTFADHQASIRNVITYIETLGMGPGMADSAMQTLRANPAILDQAPYFLTVAADRLAINAGNSFTNLYAIPSVDFIAGAVGGDLNGVLRGYTVTLGQLANQLNNAGGFVASRRGNRAHLVLVQQQQPPIDAATAGVVISAAGVLVGVGAVFVAAGIGAAVLLGGGALAVGTGIALAAIGLGVALAGGIIAVQTTRELIYQHTTGPMAGSMPGDCNGPAALRSMSCPTPQSEK